MSFLKKLAFIFITLVLFFIPLLSFANSFDCPQLIYCKGKTLSTCFFPIDARRPHFIFGMTPDTPVLRGYHPFYGAIGSSTPSIGYCIYWEQPNHAVPLFYFKSALSNIVPDMNLPNQWELYGDTADCLYRNGFTPQCPFKN